LFEAALGIAPPWFVAGVRFVEASKVLTVAIDYTAGRCPTVRCAWSNRRSRASSPVAVGWNCALDRMALALSRD
jgi:hypothetical protein